MNPLLWSSPPWVSGPRQHRHSGALEAGGQDECVKLAGGKGSRRTIGAVRGSALGTRQIYAPMRSKRPSYGTLTYRSGATSPLWRRRLASAATCRIVHRSASPQRFSGFKCHGSTSAMLNRLARWLLLRAKVTTDDYVDRVRARLLTGDLLDVAFDKLLPLGARAKSGIHWSPLSVARSAASRFAASGARRVLDVGCGPGKFCIGAAFTRPELQLHGVDRSADLVRIATDLTERLALVNVTFTVGDAFELPWSAFDGFYFFNPFDQNSFGSCRSLNDRSEASEVELGSELLLVAQLLSTARVGATIVTYHGLGGPIPSSYDLVSEEPCGSGCLRTWVRTRARELAFYHLECANDVSRVPRSYLERKYGAASSSSRAPDG